MVPTISTSMRSAEEISFLTPSLRSLPVTQRDSGRRTMGYGCSPALRGSLPPLPANLVHMAARSAVDEREPLSAIRHLPHSRRSLMVSLAGFAAGRDAPQIEMAGFSYSEPTAGAQRTKLRAGRKKQTDPKGPACRASFAFPEPGSVSRRCGGTKPAEAPVEGE